MAKRISLYAMFTACALIFSYIEALFSLNFIAPGVKLGLANCVAMLLLLKGHTKGAFLVNVARILISCLLFSVPTTLIFSLSAGICSLVLIWALSKTKIFSPVGLCAAGGAVHNIVQILVAIFFTGTIGVVYLLPILLICGTLCGVLTGFISVFADKYLKRFNF